MRMRKRGSGALWRRRQADHCVVASWHDSIIIMPHASHGW